ncbi:hypothetical protein PVAP13_6NG328550 [Panicum virgatum]|uniref:Uncharacterized protein n=1 Tax=Panicum virgatum TaxID=38727 RepID=A0A8T0R3P1_PANVG|nr:hypothetical protein PVAP13_6NG328550 [Panicum virgatum]
MLQWMWRGGGLRGRLRVAAIGVGRRRPHGAARAAAACVGVAPDASATCAGGGHQQPRGRPAPDATGSLELAASLPLLELAAEKGPHGRRRLAAEQGPGGRRRASRPSRGPAAGSAPRSRAGPPRPVAGLAVSRRSRGPSPRRRRGSRGSILLISVDGARASSTLTKPDPSQLGVCGRGGVRATVGALRRARGGVLGGGGGSGGCGCGEQVGQAAALLWRPRCGGLRDGGGGLPAWRRRRRRGPRPAASAWRRMRRRLARAAAVGSRGGGQRRMRLGPTREAAMGVARRRRPWGRPAPDAAVGVARWRPRGRSCPSSAAARGGAHRRRCVHRGVLHRATAMAVKHVRRPRHGTAAGWTAGMTAAGTAMGMPD